MQKVFHQVRVDRSGKPVKWYQLLIIFLVRFMTTLWTLFANVFFFFGASKGTSLVNTPVLFSIPFLYILFFSLALCVISLILSFFLKEHTGLEELCSHSVLEDNSEEYWNCIRIIRFFERKKLFLCDFCFANYQYDKNLFEQFFDNPALCPLGKKVK